MRGDINSLISQRSCFSPLRRVADTHRPPPAESLAETPLALISETDRRHDFGDSIARPGQTLSHAYRLTNTTDHDIKIVDAINRKPCCGVITLGKNSLHPGESTEHVMKLAIGGKFGEVVHETEVITDPHLSEELILRTSATAYPAIRVEEETTTHETMAMIKGGQSQEVAYRILATGTESDPPADLSRIEISSTIGARWDGSVENSPADDGLTIATRRLVATLSTNGEPRGRSSPIAFLDGKSGMYQHTVTWDVVSPLTATPKVVVVRNGEKKYRILLQSQDRSLFRITRIESQRQGVEVKAREQKPARVQTVDIDAVAAKSTDKGSLTVFTDHPTQPTIVIPFMVLD